MAAWKSWLLIVLLGLLVTLSACGAPQEQGGSSNFPSEPLLSNSVNIDQRPTQAPDLAFPRQEMTPTPSPTSKATTPPTATPTMIPATSSGGLVMPTTGKGASPYGSPPPLTALEKQLTQQLFAKINADRAARGLFPYAWNATLSGGARLHSWNMFHCGFSHTCPDGSDQCDRIAAEGFAGYTDCGENIAYAGPYPTPWGGVSKIQDGMLNEPPSGWHHIHLLSTTLHRVGVGVYVDPSGYIWFTEDLVS